MKKSPILLLSDDTQDTHVIYPGPPLAISAAPVSEWQIVDMGPVAVLSDPTIPRSRLVTQLRAIIERLERGAVRLPNLAI